MKKTDKELERLIELKRQYDEKIIEVAVMLEMLEDKQKSLAAEIDSFKNKSGKKA